MVLDSYVLSEREIKVISDRQRRQDSFKDILPFFSQSGNEMGTWLGDTSTVSSSLAGYDV